MQLKQWFVCLFLLGLLFSVNAKAASGFGGEILISPQFGGTDFDQTTGSVKHSRSWNFGNNWGASMIVKGAFHGEIVSVGLGADVGWKTEAVAHTQNNVVGEYDYQLLRAYVGPYLTFGKMVHFYLGYDPLVYSKVTYTDNEHLNQFRKDDVLKGYAYTVGFGINKDDVIFRILGRTTIYNKAKLSGTERSLPDAEYSKIDTGELVFQLGQRF